MATKNQKSIVNTQKIIRKEPKHNAKKKKALNHKGRQQEKKKLTERNYKKKQET